MAKDYVLEDKSLIARLSLLLLLLHLQVLDIPTAIKEHRR